MNVAVVRVTARFVYFTCETAPRQKKPLPPIRLRFTDRGCSGDASWEVAQGSKSMVVQTQAVEISCALLTTSHVSLKFVKNLQRA